MTFDSNFLLHNMSHINRGDKITIIITNKSNDFNNVAVLFDATLDKHTLTENVEIKILESSIEELRGFRLRGMEVIVENYLQLLNPLNIISRNCIGEENIQKIIPENFKDPRNFESRMIKTNNFNVVIDQNTSIHYLINAGESVRLVFGIDFSLRPRQQRHFIKDIVKEYLNSEYNYTHYKSIYILII